MNEDDYLGTTWQRATFNPAGFAETVQEWLHGEAGEFVEEGVEGAVDDVELYFLWAWDTFHYGDGFTACTHECGPSSGCDF